MKSYLLWILVISATDGSLVESRPADLPPMTAVECVKARDGRVSVAKDGKVEIFVCERMTKDTAVI
jgi:hypothetical protein